MRGGALLPLILLGLMATACSGAAKPGTPPLSGDTPESKAVEAPAPLPTQPPLPKSAFVTLRPLSVAGALPLPSGVTLYMSHEDVGAVGDIVRVETDGGGGLKTTLLTAAITASVPQDLRQPGDREGVYSWAGDAAMREIVAAVCVSSDCGPGYGSSERRKALLFRSLDGGDTWSPAGEINGIETIVTVNSGSAILDTRNGAGTNAYHTYRTHPGGEPVEPPSHPGATWYLRDVAGYGLIWSMPGGPVFDFAGKPLVSNPGAGGGLPVPAAADSTSIYWRLNDVLFRAVRDGGPIAGWVFGSLSWYGLAVLPDGWLVANVRLGPDSGAPQVPALIDPASATIHPIAGLTARPGEPQRQVMRVVAQ